MKKFLSMVLAIALVLTTLVIPAVANENAIVVNITSIADGDIFTAGTTIKLSANAPGLAESEVKNLDFYANGVKLPGTIAGTKGSIFWNAPSEGVYNISTKVTFSGGNVEEGNQSVRIVVMPPEDEMVILYPTDRDIRELLNDSTMTENGMSESDYRSKDIAFFGTEAVKIVPQNGTKFTVSYKYDQIPITWDRTAVVVYSPNVKGNATVTPHVMNGETSSTLGTAGGYTTLTKGVNVFSTATATRGTKLDKVDVTFSNIPANNTEPVYICGIVGLYNSNPVAVPVATSEISDGTASVCNKLGKYRINFSEPIFPDATKELVVTNTTDGSMVEGVTYTWGTDFVIVNLPDLGYEKTYEVKIPANTVKAYNASNFGDYQAKYVAETAFNFSTKATDCNGATAVVKMSYPAAGQVSSTTGFAAQVVAPSSAFERVVFCNGTEVLGEGEKLTDGEWWLASANLASDGIYNVVAKCVNANGEAVAESAAVTYTAIREVAAVDIEATSDSGAYTAGSVITLSADASALENVKNIDFYANGKKLPGTIVGNTGEILWKPVEGVYELSTIVTDVEGETLPGSETMKIVVMPSEDEIVVIYPNNDVKVTSSGSISFVNENAIYGTESIKLVPQNNMAVRITPSNNDVTWARTAVVIYSPALTGKCTVAPYFDGSSTALGMAGRYDSITTGINYFATADVGTAKKLDSILISFSGLPENNTEPIYICGAVGAKGASYNLAAPVASSEIASGKSGISTNLGSYRINFNEPIFPDATKELVVTNTTDGSMVEGVTYTWGTGFVEANLPALASGKTYEVKIPANTIKAYNANATGDFSVKYVAETAFTFTTAESANPVVNITYPSSGTVKYSAGFAAQIVSPGSGNYKVVFYNGAEVFGEAAEMTDGEWWFKSETPIPGGIYNLVAKCIDNDGNVISESAAVTYTVQGKSEFFVKGIGNGDVIVAAEEPSRTITVVDIVNASKLPVNATNVEKVEFYAENDVLIDTADSAPYETEIVFNNYGEHQLKTVVYDIYGDIWEETSTYTVVNATENANYSYSQNFDTADFNDVKTNFYANVSGDLNNETATVVSDGKLTVTNPNTSSMRQFAFKYAPANTGAKVYYYEYDVMFGTTYTLSMANVWATALDNILDSGATGDNIPAKAQHTIGLIIDFNSNTAVVRLNGQELKRISLAGTYTDNVILLNQLAASADVTIDNFKFAVYNPDNTANFGTSVYDREYDIVDGSVTITTGATNTSGVAEGLVNVIAVYDAYDRLLAVKEFDTVDYANGDFKTQTYNVPVTEEDAAKVRVFTLNADGTVAPIGLYK